MAEQLFSIESDVSVDISENQNINTQNTLVDESVTEDIILKERPLKYKYRYTKKPQINGVKREENGALVSRSIVGAKASYAAVEAQKFL